MALVEFQNNQAPYINAENLNHNFNELNKFGDVKLKSKGAITTATITSSNGYGIVLIVSSMFTCILQLGATNVAIHDIYGTHGTMQASIDNNVVTITGLYDWDHYIFIGSSVITDIE